MFPTKSLMSMLALVGMATAFKGQATHYTPGLGACGRTNTESDHVAAISKGLYVAAAGEGPNCFKNINVQYKGKSVEVLVVDKCEACKEYDIDLSPSAFREIDALGDGRIDVTWAWA